MRIFIYLYILKLIAHTESATNPKAVNVQLETVLEFNDKDKDADVKFIGNIEKILSKVKTALSPESGRRSQSIYNSNYKQNIQFSDFILTAVNILLSYDDDDLESAFTILDDEIRKYHYKGCKFYELVQDENVRKFVARQLDDLKKNKAKTLRRKLYKLVTIIENAKLTTRHKQFLDYINSLYRHESSKTFIDILQNIENYSYKSKRSNMNLIEITRSTIRSVLFDYFSKLSPNVRKDIKKNIENTWSHITNSKWKQSNNGNPFVDILDEETQANNKFKEDKIGASSSVSNEGDKKTNKPNVKDTNAAKKKHAMVRQADKKKRSFLTHSFVKYSTKKLKFEPLWKEKENKKRGNLRERDDFNILTEKTELELHSFEKKEKKKKNKQHKIQIKIKEEISKNVDDSVQVEKKRKKNKHHKNVEDTVTVKEEKRNNVKSESSMKRPETGAHKDIFIDFNTSDETRHSDKDLETKVPPRKRQKSKRKQFMNPTAKLNVYSHSDEGMSIEGEHYRRAMSSDRDSEIDKERHKVSAEIIRKHFIRRINNLEKQMEEIVRKVDDTPTKNDVYDVDKKTTEEKVESSTETLNKLNKTVKTNKTGGTTMSYHIIIGSEYIPDDDNISNEIPSTEVITNSFNITDNGKMNISYRQNTILSEEASQTDFDYSEAGIMKKLNLTFPVKKPNSNERVIEEKPKEDYHTGFANFANGIMKNLNLNLTIPEEKPKNSERLRDIEEKPKKPDGEKIKGNNDNNNNTGMHRIEIPRNNDNKIIQTELRKA